MIGATGIARQRRADFVGENLQQGGFPGAILPRGQSETPDGSRSCQGLSQHAPRGPGRRWTWPSSLPPPPPFQGIIRDCAESGVRAAVIISAGFKETGAAGVELERQILLAEARQRVGCEDRGGPNCLGVMAPGAKSSTPPSPHAAWLVPGAVLVSSARAARSARPYWIGVCARMWAFSAFASLGFDARCRLG